VTETAKTHWRRALPWLIGGFLLAYVYAFLVAITTGDSELYECQDFAQAVLAKHSIPESKSAPGHPGMSCPLEVQMPFLIRYEKAYIYGVTDGPWQDSIARTLQEFRARYHSRKILVQFFDRENWKTWSNPDTGAHGGERGPEIPIRLIWIK
jgi:hypothetical protein